MIGQRVNRIPRPRGRSGPMVRILVVSYAKMVSEAVRMNGEENGLSLRR